MTYPHTRLLLACTLLTATAPTQDFVNGSFEAWGSAACQINDAPDGWTKFNSPGLGSASGCDEGDFSACPHTIPGSAHSGSHYARSYGSTANGSEGIAQTVSGFVPGRTYRISFWQSGSNLYGGISDGAWTTFVDGALVDTGPTIGSLTASWSEHQVQFTATAASHTIGFRSLQVGTTSTSSLGLDSVSIRQPAAVLAYGVGCPAAAPLTLQSTPPALGTSWQLDALAIESASPIAVFWLGDAQTSPGLDLTGIGATGCFAYTNGNLDALLRPAANGTASLAITIPNNTVLLGAVLSAQASAQSSSNPIGFTTSNGLLATLGL